MEQLWLLVAILVCPLVMGGMMIWMMRGQRHGHPEREAVRGARSAPGTARPVPDGTSQSRRASESSGGSTG